MLYDALFAVALPTTLGPPVRTGFWEGVERLLFTGRTRRRMAVCGRSPAVVLAGVYGALREAPAGAAHPRFTVTDDADEVLDLGAALEGWTGEVPRFAERLPPRWTEEPCAFGLTAAWEEGGFAQVVRLRHTPRHDVEQTAVTGSVRVLWRPEKGGAALARRLRSRQDASELAQRLRVHGSRVTDDVLARLQVALDGAVAHRARVVVLVDQGRPDAFADLLAGFSEPARRAVPEISEALVGEWPALAANGVAGTVRSGRFVPVEGVPDVV